MKRLFVLSLSLLKKSSAICCIGFFLTNSSLDAVIINVGLRPIAVNIPVVVDLSTVGNYLYICGQTGLLLRKNLNTSSTTDYETVVDIRATVGVLGTNVPSIPILGYPVPETYDERGLLGFTAHPDFDNINGTFWIRYSNLNEHSDFNNPATRPPDFYQWNISTEQPWNENQYDHTEYVDEYQMVNGVVSKVRTILKLKCPFFNHAGFSSLGWSPEQDTLLLGLGDGGSEYDPFNLAQNPNIVWGKLLALNLPVLSDIAWDTKAPVTRFSELPANAVTPLITGMRNPTKVHFERTRRDRRRGTYTKYVGNTGQDVIDYIHGFRNYDLNFGWRPWEGNFNTSIRPKNSTAVEILYPLEATALSNYYGPLVTYNHYDPVLDPVALTGICLYRGTSIPELNGDLVYTDWTRRSPLGSPLDPYFHGSILHSRPDRSDLENVVPTEIVTVDFSGADAATSDFFFTNINTDTDRTRIFVGGFKTNEFIVNQNTFPLGDPNLLGGVYEVIPL